MLIEPYMIYLLNSYENSKDLVAEEDTRENIFKDQNIRQQDLFSIIFLVLSIWIPDLPLVYSFRAENPKIMIGFNSNMFKQILDKFFLQNQSEMKLIKIIKKLVNYDCVVKGKRYQAIFNLKGNIMKMRSPMKIYSL